MKYLLVVFLVIMSMTSVVNAKPNDPLNFKLSIPNLKNQDQDEILITQQKLIAEIKKLREINTVLTKKIATLDTVVEMYTQLTELQTKQITDLNTVITKKDTVVGNYEKLVDTLTKQNAELKARNEMSKKEIERLRKGRTRERFVFTAIGFIGAQILERTR